MSGILFVCTANQIRSAIAERLMQVGLRAQFGAATDALTVASAGTHAHEGLPIWPQAAVELELRGISAEGHASRLLAPGLIRRATLVLTASRTHRDHVTQLWPQALGSAFTLTELAWLLTDLYPDDLPGRRLTERLEALPQLARLRRPQLPPLTPDAYDIADPVGGTEADFARAAIEIEQALAVLLGVL